MEMNNITVGESALKVVVPEKKFEGWVGIKLPDGSRSTINSKKDLTAEYYNESIDKTLSTPLPDVNSCVEIDVENLEKIMNKVLDTPVGSGSFDEYIKEDFDDVERLAKAIANSKSILKWKKDK